MCEQIATVSKDRLGRFLCHLSDADMARVDRAIKVSLGLEGGEK
jgi:mRNA-degrading endonuclease toxin of MazEF toxin-antitoxin module